MSQKPPRSNLEYILWGIIFVGFIGFTACSPALLSNPTEGQRILEQQGYTNVKFIGVAYNSCGRGDIRQDRFEVTNPKSTFTVTVCSGLWKGYTVRY
jgi:hypothetical protein